MLGFLFASVITLAMVSPIIADIVAERELITFSPRPFAQWELDPTETFEVQPEVDMREWLVRGWTPAASADFAICLD